MELFVGFLIVAMIALLGAMADSFGVDSRPHSRRGDVNEWL